MIVNIEQAKDLVESDKEFYLELTATFFQEYDSMLAEIRSALASSNAEVLNRSAHTIKGALGNLCAIKARELAFQLEKCGKENRFQGANELLTQLEQAVADYKKYLNDEIVNGSAW